MAVTETQLLEKGLKNSDWVQRNFDELAKKYEGKLIAVEDEEVIAASDTMEDLIRQIESKGKNPAETFVTSFPPSDSIWVF
jgi:hypothetical protein